MPPLLGRALLVGLVAGLVVGVAAASPSPASQELASEVPKAVSPGLGDAFPRIDRLCPTFSWASLPAAEEYELVVLRIGGDTDGRRDSPEVSHTAETSSEVSPPHRVRLPRGSSSWTPAGADCLEPGSRWAWQIRSILPTGEGDWSEALFFATGPKSEPGRKTVSRSLRDLGDQIAERRDPNLDRAFQAFAEHLRRTDGTAEDPRPVRPSAAGAAAGLRLSSDGLVTGGSVTTSELRSSTGGSFFSLGSSCIDNSHITQITADGTVLCAPDSGDVSSVTAGSGLVGGNSSGAVTLSHSNTSSATSVNGSNGSVIQDVSVDTYGHVTLLRPTNLDGRYYTQAQSDTRFLRVTGALMSGSLGISSGPPQAKLHVDNGSDVGAASGGFAILGDLSSRNIGIDDNEIMARTNGAPAALYLQVEGGTVSIGTNSTDETLNVGGDTQLNGAVRRDASGAADLLPLAYGKVGNDGIVVLGSGNISSIRTSEGSYRVAVDGVTSRTDLDYVAIASPATSIANYNIGISASSFDPYWFVRCYALPLGVLADCAFSFVIYEP